MSSSTSSANVLRHVRDEAAFIARHTRGLSFEAFERDEALKRAVVRSLEVIGEATKQLPPVLLERYPDVPWRQAARMRDRLIHGYLTVDYELVWDTVQNGIPVLSTTVERMITALGEDA